MLENEKRKILEKTRFLNIRKNAKTISIYEKSKRKNFILSIFLCLVIIISVYFLTSISNIYRITVVGNYYLHDEDIVELAQISTSSKYLLTFPTSIEKKIKKSNLIKNCDVNLLDGRIVQIKVEEYKVIGYANEDKQNVLVLENDDRYVLDSSNIYLIENVPLLQGFTKEQLLLIEKNFVELDKKVINEISEIHYYPLLKYQDHEIIMRDGNYIFTSVYGLNKVKEYYDIKSMYVTNDNVCYYIEDISGNAYISACPWIVSKDTDTKIEIEDD